MCSKIPAGQVQSLTPLGSEVLDEERKPVTCPALVALKMWNEFMNWTTCQVGIQSAALDGTSKGSSLKSWETFPSCAL